MLHLGARALICEPVRTRVLSGAQSFRFNSQQLEGAKRNKCCSAPSPSHPHWRACLLVCGAWQLFPFRALAGSFDCNWQHLVRHVWRTRPASFYKQQYLNKGFRNIAHVSFFFSRASSNVLCTNTRTNNVAQHYLQTAYV